MDLALASDCSMATHAGSAAQPPTVEALQRQMEELAARDPRLAELMQLPHLPDEHCMSTARHRTQGDAPSAHSDARAIFTQLSTGGRLTPRPMYRFLLGRATSAPAQRFLKEICEETVSDPFGGALHTVLQIRATALQIRSSVALVV
eukprot:SAG31_NODE_2491_length_5612_cov_23.752766_1_plen_147_part_00